MLICIIDGIIFSWIPYSQKNITDSKIESEYIALSECIQEFKFVLHKIESV